MIDLGVKLGFVNKAGAWYSYGEVRIGQGKDNSRQFLKEHPEMSAEIEHKIREELLPKPSDKANNEISDANTQAELEEI